MSESKDKYKTVWTNKFKKEYKLAMKRGKNLAKLDEIIRLLARGLDLPASLCDHELKGNWKNHRELHIEGDWLLIYQKKDDILILMWREQASTQICFKDKAHPPERKRG